MEKINIYSEAVEGWSRMKGIEFYYKEISCFSLPVDEALYFPQYWTSR